MERPVPSGKSCSQNHFTESWYEKHSPKESYKIPSLQTQFIIYYFSEKKKLFINTNMKVSDEVRVVDSFKMTRSHRTMIIIVLPEESWKCRWCAMTIVTKYNWIAQISILEFD